VQVASGASRNREASPAICAWTRCTSETLDGAKGLYHINAADEVTQWQVLGAVAAITQSHLEPILKAIFKQFPFPIRGFHSGNGSEFINDTVSGSLKRLLIGQENRPVQAACFAEAPVALQAPYASPRISNRAELCRSLN
jgi:hypothetical protein